MTSRAHSAALGMAAAAALTGAASAAPLSCTGTDPPQATFSTLACPADAQTRTAVATAEAGSQLPGSDPSSLRQTEEAATLGSDIFAELGVKITNLQATMTSNTPVAGQLPIAPRADELTMYAPDYLSVKLLPSRPRH